MNIFEMSHIISTLFLKMREETKCERKMFSKLGFADEIEIYYIFISLNLLSKINKGHPF